MSCSSNKQSFITCDGETEFSAKRCHRIIVDSCKSRAFYAVKHRYLLKALQSFILSFIHKNVSTLSQTCPGSSPLSESTKSLYVSIILTGTSARTPIKAHVPILYCGIASKKKPCKKERCIMPIWVRIDKTTAIKIFLFEKKPRFIKVCRRLRQAKENRSWVNVQIQKVKT